VPYAIAGSYRQTIPDNEHAASLADETGDESRFPKLFQYAMPIALKSLYAREDEHAMRIAIAEASEELGMKADEIPSPEKRDAFGTLLAKKIAIYFEQVTRHLVWTERRELTYLPDDREVSARFYDAVVN
jgi:hypothetical protein